MEFLQQSRQLALAEHDGKARKFKGLWSVLVDIGLFYKTAIICEGVF